MAIPKALKPWADHLAKYRKAHPKQSMKAAMQAASKTFKKQKGKGKFLDAVKNKGPPPFVNMDI